MIDLRALSTKKLDAPAPLPHVSRKALKRIKHPMQPPKACNCCDSPSVQLVNNSEIYNGRSYGDWPFAYQCLDCKAYVGLHPDTDLPLGTLADKPLREARNRCKAPFELIWKKGHMSRTAAYKWLAERLSMTTAECHFGLFDAQQCERARAACQTYLEACA